NFTSVPDEEAEAVPTEAATCTKGSMPILVTGRGGLFSSYSRTMSKFAWNLFPIRDSCLRYYELRQTYSPAGRTAVVRRSRASCRAASRPHLACLCGLDIDGNRKYRRRIFHIDGRHFIPGRIFLAYPETVCEAPGLAGPLPHHRRGPQGYRPWY